MLETREDELFDTKAKHLMRQQWVKAQMKSRKESYTDPEPLSLFCGTYNVNGKANLGAESLTKWIFPDGLTCEAKDLYILGFQEIVELTPVNVAVDPMGLSRSQYWLTHIAACFVAADKFNNCGDYVLVGVKHLVGVMLCIYTKKSLLKAVKDVRWATNAVGIMGVMGNKGGVTCRFSYHSTSICVVCAHLAASRDNIAHRNEDYKNITKQTLLKKDKNVMKSSFAAEETSGAGGGAGGGGHTKRLLLASSDENESSDYMIADHDLVFWIGDFNYRIDVSLTRQDILDMITNNQINDLRIFDQLNIERSMGKVFENFHEGEITFPPTYKFQVGTDLYEDREGKKKRPPAWCDRILWSEQRHFGDHSKHEVVDDAAGVGGSAGDRTNTKTSTGAANTNSTTTTTTPKKEQRRKSAAGAPAVQLVNYRSADLHASDHKPVSADFHLTVRSVVDAREQAVYLGLLKELDHLENSGQPKVTVGPLDFHAEHLGYMSQQVFTFEISNVGETLAKWRFVPPSLVGPAGVAEQWCLATPSLGMLSPHESATIKIEMFADLRSLSLLLDKLTANEARHTPPPPPPPPLGGESGGDEEAGGEGGGRGSESATPESIATSKETTRDDNDDDDDEEEGGGGGNRRGQTSAAQTVALAVAVAVAVVKLQEIMVLRVENGRDYFLSLSADFCPSQADKDLMTAEYAKFSALKPADVDNKRTESGDRSAEPTRDRKTSTEGNKKANFFAPEKKEQIKKRWGAIQSNIFKMKESAVHTVKSRANKSSSSGPTPTPQSTVDTTVNSSNSNKEVVGELASVVLSQTQSHVSAADDSDGSDCSDGRITSVRVNRTSANLTTHVPESSADTPDAFAGGGAGPGAGTGAGPGPGAGPGAGAGACAGPALCSDGITDDDEVEQDNSREQHA